jgi:hypothetical protein
MADSNHWQQGNHEEEVLRVHISPIIKEALSSVGPGEDLDEALLRALKSRYPQHAAALLPACTRLIEIEAKGANGDKQQTLRRLAESDPEIVLRTSGGEVPTTIAETRVIRIGDKEYHSLEEVPPHLRRIVERGMQGQRPAPRVGCSWTLIGGWLAALLRLTGK